MKTRKNKGGWFGTTNKRKTRDENIINCRRRYSKLPEVCGSTINKGLADVYDYPGLTNMWTKRIALNPTRTITSRILSGHNKDESTLSSREIVQSEKEDYEELIHSQQKWGIDNTNEHGEQIFVEQSTPLRRINLQDYLDSKHYHVDGHTYDKINRQLIRLQEDYTRHIPGKTERDKIKMYNEKAKSLVDRTVNPPSKTRTLGRAPPPSKRTSEVRYSDEDDL